MTMTTALAYTVEVKQPTAKSRRIETAYTIEDLDQVDAHGRPIKPLLVAYVSHDPERKLYRFHVDRETVTTMDSPAFSLRSTVIHIGGVGIPDEVKRLWFAERADRYSMRHLVTAHAEYVRDFIEPNLDYLLQYAVGALLEAR